MTLTTICFLTRMPHTYSCQMVEALFYPAELPTFIPAR